MNWRIFEKEMISLSESIDCEPDIIVGLTRGGLVPARLLSNYLQVEEMFCLNIVKSKKGRKVVSDILVDLKNMNLLLVEDMLETGKGLVVAKRFLESKGAKVKTACLYIMPATKIKPDFYLREVSEVEDFPWE